MVLEFNGAAKAEASFTNNQSTPRKPTKYFSANSAGSVWDHPICLRAPFLSIRSRASEGAADANLSAFHRQVNPPQAGKPLAEHWQEWGLLERRILSVLSLPRLLQQSPSRKIPAEQDLQWW